MRCMLIMVQDRTLFTQTFLSFPAAQQAMGKAYRDAFSENGRKKISSEEITSRIRTAEECNKAEIAEDSAFVTDAPVSHSNYDWSIVTIDF